MIVIFENQLTICKFAIISVQSSIVGAPLPTRTAWPLISGDVDCHTLNFVGTSATIGHYKFFQWFSNVLCESTSEQYVITYTILYWYHIKKTSKLLRKKYS